MKPTYYSEVSEGALLLHQQILAAARENPEIKTLYKGCQLLFSPLLELPMTLIVDFNPGGGKVHRGNPSPSVHLIFSKKT